ncbi:MAG TPA: serine/threonine protein phosphatase [Ruminococcus sp.]|nr:serine/threonine protein phosphatase [Ruminococcus sp.]
MGLFTRDKPKSDNGIMIQSERTSSFIPYNFGNDIYEKNLYDGLRFAVPVIDAALCKIVRLTGGYSVICNDASMQEQLDRFIENVPVGISSKSLQSFTDMFLDSLITYGNAVGEIVIDDSGSQIAGLFNGNVCNLEVRNGSSPFERNFFIRNDNGSEIMLPYPERIIFSALNPPDGQIYGRSVLRGLPALSSILMRIYECIGQNYDRVGNVRYAVTYKPSGDIADRNMAKERAMQIASEWSSGMSGGSVKDFIAVGDVDIKVIGAENQLIDTNIPVRQLLEQLVSKLSIPPFLLGLNWSSTERMSSQQADILTSELEYYRRLITPVIKQVASAFLRLNGCCSEVTVVWDNINLQDEVELADARLKNAQAEEIEIRNAKNKI